jgi:hypothetical protein
MEFGFLSLLFTENDEWGLRMCCLDCYFPENYLESNDMILNAQEPLKEVIEYGLSHGNRICLVCEQRNCKDKECLKAKDILYTGSVNFLMEHFYQIRLNVITPVVKNLVTLCHACQLWESTISCSVCKIRLYCSKSCKKKDKHSCVAFWDMWRSY